KRGIMPTMSLDEALSQFGPAKVRLNSEPRIGRCFPEISYEEYQALVAIFTNFNPCVMDVAPDRCARPRSQVLNSQQPEPAPSPADAPPPEETQTAAGPARPPRGDEQAATTSEGTAKRLKPGDAALKICSALRSLATEGKWNVAEAEIM